MKKLIISEFFCRNLHRLEFKFAGFNCLRGGSLSSRLFRTVQPFLAADLAGILQLRLARLEQTNSEIPDRKIT